MQHTPFLGVVDLLPAEHALDLLEYFGFLSHSQQLTESICVYLGVCEIQNEVAAIKSEMRVSRLVLKKCAQVLRGSDGVEVGLQGAD